MINAKVVRTINLKEVCEAAGNQSDAIWEEVSNRTLGNQVFCNDTLFIYWLPSLNGDENSPTQKLIAAICADAIVDDEIVFEVMW